MHYSVTAIDVDGRLAARSALAALRWQPGLPVAVTAAQHALVITPQQKSSHVLDRQGHLRLPATARHLTRLKAGDRLLLAASLDRSLLLVYPVAVLDTMVLAYHLGAPR
ncbi:MULTISPECIES: hypothetical protein [Micromonospora]|uniref:hypothetical protein n=1 Tax=Micromonospora TaxID=1873 RepID=UPI001E496304|nr:hypothetical protein [Verrucosispora sp. ts21]